MKKRALLLVVLLGLMSSVALALPPMGPPTAGLKTGQLRVGVEYAYSDVDMESEGETIDGVTSNMIYGNIGYGLMDEWEAFARLGVANVEVDEFDGDYGFAWGLGTKYTFLKQEGLDWGALFQITWLNSEDDDLDTELDFYEMQIAVGPTWKCSDTLSIYGGPFVHLVDGDIDEAGCTYDLEEDSAFGGYVGAEAVLAENTSLFGEFQFTGAGYGFGVGVGWKF